MALTLSQQVAAKLILARNKVLTEGKQTLAKVEQVVENAVGSVEKEVEIIGKWFYAKVHYSRFIYEDGTETIFHGGKAYITDPAKVKELEKIIPPLGNNPNIYTESKQVVPLVPPKQNAISDGAADVVDAQIAATNPVKIEQQIGDGAGASLDIALASAAANQSAIPVILPIAEEGTAVNNAATTSTS